MAEGGLGWLSIIRLGLVQASLGAVVVLATSTLNRIIIIEFAYPAIVPGFLVGLHYALQMLRPRMGYGSDAGGRRTSWIIGGMAVLATGGCLAALSTLWMAEHGRIALIVASAAYAMIGCGVSASGTTLLVLLAKQVHPSRRAAASAIVWIMMIAGFALASGIVGHFLDPFSPARLVRVATLLCSGAFCVAVVSIFGVERPAPITATQPDEPTGASEEQSRGTFKDAISAVWSEAQSRRFAFFIFISMLAYSAQELLIEPYAGAVFGFTPGKSSKLSSLQHGGAVAGMIIVAAAGSIERLRKIIGVTQWIVAGCVGSGATLLAIGAGSFMPHSPPLAPLVFILGLSNGVFAIAAIGTMMSMVGEGAAGHEGTRMGLWGAAQGIAFGLGGVLGPLASDAMRHIMESRARAYGVVFFCEAGLFLWSSLLATTLRSPAPRIASRRARGFGPMAALGPGADDAG